jgi:hypothetical protein
MSSITPDKNIVNAPIDIIAHKPLKDGFKMSDRYPLGDDPCGDNHFRRTAEESKNAKCSFNRCVEVAEPINPIEIWGKPEVPSYDRRGNWIYWDEDTSQKLIPHRCKKHLFEYIG